jgi:two-component sensor histidine kinase
MGLVLVRGLTRQIGGTCRLESGPGTRWVVQLGDRRAPSPDPSLH